MNYFLRGILVFFLGGLKTVVQKLQLKFCNQKCWDVYFIWSFWFWTTFCYVEY